MFPLNKMASNKKSKNFCFTIFNISETESDELKNYPELKHAICGDIPLPPGKKRDYTKFESYVSLLEKGQISLNEIKKADIAHYIGHEAHYLNVHSKLTERSIRPPTFVCWFSGTTGTGKSYTANCIAKHLGFEIYQAGCENNFFNSYNGEECSIWDDYRSGPISFETLLKITDRNGCTINVKKGKVFFSPKIQIFTSPEGIESAKTTEMKIFGNLDNTLERLKRRIHFTTDFDSLKTKTNPDFSEVQRASEYVKIRCLGVYKKFLIDEGFEQFIDLIPALVPIEPIPFKRLIETDPENRIYCKTSVKKIDARSTSLTKEKRST